MARKKASIDKHTPVMPVDPENPEVDPDDEELEVAAPVLPALTESSQLIARSDIMHNTTLYHAGDVVPRGAHEVQLVESGAVDVVEKEPAKEEVAVEKMSKVQLLQFCEESGIEVPEDATKKEILEIIQSKQE